MNSLYALLISAAFLPSANDSTQDAVRNLLQTVWKTPAANAKRVGNGTVSRAAKQKADMADVQYAYGLLLAHHEDWEAAEAVFKRVVKGHPKHVDSLLALCACQLLTGKNEPALDTLLKAAEADPKSAAVANFSGNLLTFWSQVPPEKPKKARLESIKAELFAKLNPDAQANFRAAADEAHAYIADKPNRLAKAKEDAKDVQKETTKLQQTLHTLEVERLQREQDLVTLTNEAQLLAQGVQAVNAQYAVLINQAIATGDKQSAQNLRVQQSLAASQSSSRYAVNIEQTTLTRNRIAAIDRQRLEIAQSVRKAEDNARNVERRFEEEERKPPIPFTPEAERDRLLAKIGNSDPAAPKSAAGKSTPKNEDEKKAKSLLGLADTLRQSGSPDKAAEYYRRIVTLYPNTQAAQVAKVELGNESPKSETP